MAAFTTVGPGWRVEDLDGGDPYRVCIAWEAPRRRRARRLVGVAGGEDALEELLAARAVEVVSKGRRGLREEPSGAGPLVHVLFDVVVVKPGPTSRLAVFRVEVAVAAVDGEPLRVVAMRRVK